jgi:uncharacterized membrane protein YgcG
VPTGEPFTTGQYDEIERAVQKSSTETGLAFSVFVGEPEGEPRAYAVKLHAALGEQAPRSVLLFVAPGSRRLEIVTGRDARERLPDRPCGLAALAMASSFGGGDLAGGIVNGLRMLADAAGRVPTSAQR